ncbi:hypothetical protein OEZ85_006635 [Tetradesmus obliquus]|uniref:Uncharacterized protein n=1 Tax=Tetradesmus obliquus TaxID=3088 RepID=A0ABY8TXQ4_TETOB|nr:hypothetical protein OEZ85_006635 [Tetradesmus obliquus]
MTAHEAAVCCEAVQRMLSRPAEYVPGLRAGDSIDVYRPSAQSSPGGIHLPLLLHTRCGAASAAAAASEEGSDGIRLLLELVAGNEVYGLLNRSWDQFIRFSDANNAAGRKLPVLAAAACKEAALPAAVDPTAHEQLAEQVVQLQEQLKKDQAQAAADLDSVNKELAAYKKEGRHFSCKPCGGLTLSWLMQRLA